MRKIILATILFLSAPIIVAAQTQINLSCAGGTWVPNGDGSQRCVQSNTGTSPQTPGSTLTYQPLEPLPGYNASTYNSIGTYFSYMFTLLLSIGAMIAIVTIVIAGISYMVSDVVDRKSWAKERIKAALWGLILLLSSWLILNTINPKLLDFGFFDTSLQQSQGSPIPPANTQANQDQSQDQANFSSYSDPTSCSAHDGVWQNDSASCISPLLPSISQLWGRSQADDPVSRAAADYLNSQTAWSSVGLGYTVSNSQIFVDSQENTPQDIDAANKFAQTCEAQNYFGKTKFISGSDIGYPGRDVQICYH